MSHQQQQQQQQPAAFVNKPARGWLHPDHLIAKVGPCFIVIGVADPACLSRIQIFPSQRIPWAGRGSTLAIWIRSLIKYLVVILAKINSFSLILVPNFF
jgi:hypothetical protein